MVVAEVHFVPSLAGGSSKFCSSATELPARMALNRWYKLNLSSYVAQLLLHGGHPVTNRAQVACALQTFCLQRCSIARIVPSSDQRLTQLFACRIHL